VSSQTLRNLAVVEDAARVPLLRPLVAWDKAEIVREAQSLDTYDIANLPAEDCCTLFASPLAETRAAPDQVERLEARLDLDAVVDELVRSVEVVRPRVDRELAAASLA
jgi:thiamine biosynthesis protein ThiI